MNKYAKFRCAPLRIKKALGVFRELIPTTTITTTRVDFWDPPSVSNKKAQLSLTNPRDACEKFARFT